DPITATGQVDSKHAMAPCIAAVCAWSAGKPRNRLEQTSSLVGRRDVQTSQALGEMCWGLQQQPQLEVDSSHAARLGWQWRARMMG
ncbi:MAG: hypothetical protein PVH50_10730, partial [Anaerolineae bacterium]